MSQESPNPNIRLLCQTVCPVACLHTQTHRRSDHCGHPFRVSGFFSFYLSLRIDPIMPFPCKSLQMNPPRWRYSVRYRPEGDKPGHYTHTNSSHNSLFIGSLQPATSYQFSVGLISGGRTVWSKPVTNTTMEAPPDSAPSNLTAQMYHRDPTTALLSWQPPPRSNGNITGMPA